MNTNLQIFNNPEFGEIRTIEIDGKPYFVGKDVAAALGYTNPQKALRDHVDEEDKTVNDSFTVNGTKGILVNESGLYSLILSSKLPHAKKFKHWVTSEVLPSLRKHGAYMTPQTLEEMLRNPEAMIQVLTALKEEQAKSRELAKENDKQKQIIGELQPKADYVDYILSSPGAVTITQIAADYGMSAKKLNKILWEEKVQRFVGEQWILYVEHMGQGYTKSETVSFEHSDGRPDTKMYTKWTQKGRLMINQVLNRRGIYANLDLIKSA